jgi:hypothetical protein
MAEVTSFRGCAAADGGPKPIVETT